MKRCPSLKRVSQIKSPNLRRSGGMGAAAPEIRVRKALLITDEQLFPHPAMHRLRNTK